MRHRGFFEALKGRLLAAPILGYPDPHLQYILDTDASAEGIGSVLSQIQDGQERVIAYYSKTLSPPEQNYCITQRELLAVVKSVKHFRPYLYGRKFKLQTDHASLAWLCRRHEPTSQVARWLEILSEFSYQLEHRSGTKHGNADGLSRRPACQDCKQCERIERKDGGPTHDQVEKLLEEASDQAGCPAKQVDANKELVTLQQTVEWAGGTNLPGSADRRPPYPRGRTNGWDRATET